MPITFFFRVTINQVDQKHVCYVPRKMKERNHKTWSFVSALMVEWAHMLLFVTQFKINEVSRADSNHICHGKVSVVFTIKNQ